MTVCDCCMHLFDGLADFCPECQDQFDEVYDEEDIFMRPKQMTTLEKLRELESLRKSYESASDNLRGFLIDINYDRSQNTGLNANALDAIEKLMQQFGREQFYKVKEN